MRGACKEPGLMRSACFPGSAKRADHSSRRNAAIYYVPITPQTRNLFLHEYLSPLRWSFSLREVSVFTLPSIGTTVSMPSASQTSRGAVSPSQPVASPHPGLRPRNCFLDQTSRSEERRVG